MFEQYEHHGVLVWVHSDLKGKHTQVCLCYSGNGCARFHPNTPENCAVAEENYTLCKKHNLVLPVWECPLFQENTV